MYGMLACMFVWFQVCMFFFVNYTCSPDIFMESVSYWIKTFKISQVNPSVVGPNRLEI